MPTTTQAALPTSWREGTSPSGDRMVYLRPQDLNRDNIPTKYAAIREWGKANGLQLEPIGYDLIAFNQWADFYFWTGFKVEEKKKPLNGLLFGEFPCPECEQVMPAGTGVCPNCTHIASCFECNVFGARLWVETPGDAKGFCLKCSKKCKKCDARMPNASQYEMCATCDNRVTCGGCSQVFSQTATTKRGDKHYCNECVTNFCESCDTYDRNRVQLDVAGKKKSLCKPCATKVYDEQRGKLEAWGIDELPVSGTLMIPASKVRPIRTISIETEFDGSGAEVTQALHKAGLLPSPEMDGRHRAEPSTMSYPCLMKRDGSVSGGELVTYLLDMDNANHAEALLRMTEVMKGCRDMGFAKFSKNAGGHIHIDMHGMSMRDVWAYYTLHMYLQRTLYYLGGAGADYGHRSLQGNTYAGLHDRGPFRSLREFARLFPGGRNGLNLGHWFSTRMNCQCGARAADEPENCNCNLGKATAEWRLWNAEITPRILHAWIAVMQSTTAWAQGTSDDFDESAFPYDMWKQRKLKATDTAALEAIKTRLEWMHRELPLTIHERDSLIYTAKRSELVILGEDYLDSLLDITNEGMGKEKKAAPNPATRKATQFKLKRLSKGNALSAAEINALMDQGWQIADRAVAR